MPETTEPSLLRRLVRAMTMDVSPLRASREYRLLYAGQFVSSFGSAISYVVLPVQMYQLTKSSFAVGMLGVAEFVPMLLLAFVGGALADYIDRRRLIVLSEAGMTICCGTLVANALLAQPRVGVLFGAAALFAAFSALHRPAIEALTPRILPPEMMPAVGALQGFRYSFNFIIGPAIAGVIVGTMGAAVAFALDGATFLFSLFCVLLIRAVPPPDDADLPSLQAIRDAWLYARRRHELLGTYIIDIVAMFFGMPMALFPAIAESFNGAQVGWFYSMMAVGPLLISLTSGWTSRIHRHGLAVVLSVVVWGLAIVGFGWTRNLWLALFFLALAGAADNVSGLFRMTMWNQTIPDHLRGRMASIEMISYTTGPYLGNAEAGLVAAAFGLRTSVISGGVLCVVGACALAVLLPRFVRYDGRDGIAQKEAEEAARAAPRD
ncbi:MAG: MFS transporter [Blastocatellia bacterium]|nr:MFS transporter [Blastocatellia bacterium]